MREESGLFGSNKNAAYPTMNSPYLLGDPFFSMSSHNKNVTGDLFGGSSWFGSNGGLGYQNRGASQNKGLRSGRMADDSFNHHNITNYHQRTYYQQQNRSYDDNTSKHGHFPSSEVNGIDDGQSRYQQNYNRGFRPKEDSVLKNGEDKNRNDTFNRNDPKKTNPSNAGQGLLVEIYSHRMPYQTLLAHHFIS